MLASERARLVPALMKLGLLPEVGTSWQLLSELLAHPVAMTKPLLRNAADMPFEGALRMEESAEPNCFTMTGHREAVAAFLAG